MNKAVVAAGLLMASGWVQAGCEDSFQSVGDARNGLFFSGHVKVPGLSAQSALGQMQQIALDSGYKVGGELIRGGAGELYFIQDSNNPAIVMLATADKSGKVSISTKLARGQKTETAAVRQEFCSLLAKLKTGKEGEAIAAAAREKTGANQITDAKADKLSAEIGKVVKKALAPVAAKGQSPVYLATTRPDDNAPLTRLMHAQDTGGAIRGPVRADFFWGFGHDAGALAGRMRQEGKLWLLWPADLPLPQGK